MPKEPPIERPSQRSPAVTYTLGILLAYNAWQLLQWGLIGSLAIMAVQAVDIDDPETIEAMTEEGVTPQQLTDINRGMTQWLLATMSTRLAVMVSLVWLFRSTRWAYYTLAVMTPIMLLVNLYGGDMVVGASLDLIGFMALSVALFAGTPQQWSLLK